MKALSIRQPWAWLILNAGKDIENRNWRTNFRGRVLIHAAKGMTHEELEDAEWFVQIEISQSIKIPHRTELERGGIVGSVEIVDCVRKTNCNPWHDSNSWGFVLRDPRPLPFIPLKGSLGFFEVPYVEPSGFGYAEPWNCAAPQSERRAP